MSARKCLFRKISDFLLWEQASCSIFFFSTIYRVNHAFSEITGIIPMYLGFSKCSSRKKNFQNMLEKKSFFSVGFKSCNGATLVYNPNKSCLH